MKACEVDDATGCDFAGKLLTSCEPSLVRYIPPEPARGLAYLEKGCNITSTAQMFESSESCYAAAFFHAAGLKGVGKNAAKAIELGTRGCEMGQMRACKLVADVYTREGNQEMADKFDARFKMMDRQLKEKITIEMGRT